MTSTATISSTTVTNVTKNSSGKNKKKKGQRVLFWTAECKYSVIANRVKELDWRPVDDEKMESKVNLLWIDVATIHERFRSIQPWQVINHFPGMPNIARKNRMGQNLNRLAKVFPREFSFYPRTWILPSEMNDFRNQFDSSGNSLNNRIFIVKPDAGCQGRGIFLTRTLDNVPINENVVAQQYIKKPLLIDGFKFDLRLYCFVTSVKPLRMYLFHDGLARFCTEEYTKPTKSNLDNSCMHLTNYAVNKHSENFQAPTDSGGSDEGGSKRSLTWFMNWVRNEYGEEKAKWLWKRMGIVCTRTVLSIMPALSREYDQHFRSFSNIPVDPTKIEAVSSSSNITSPVNISARKPSESRSRSTPRKPPRSSQDEDGGEDGEQEEDQDTEEDQEGTTKNNMNNNQNSNDKNHDGPTYRGSRCFEVLGVDVMLDSNLNPWLIEVNHLPSFGTDTPLDMDIKERLMEQVFSVLPVLPDDQQVYQAYQRAESERRLIAQRRTQQQLREKQEAEQQREREQAKQRAAAARARREAALNAMRADAAAAAANAQNLHDSSYQEASKVEQEQADNPSNQNDEEEFDEECTPERLEEIKEILRDVYIKYSPEKVGKIDRLLIKYAGHEEEFLRFVFNKYGVPPELYKKADSKSSGLAAESGSPEKGDQDTSSKTTSSGMGESANDAETVIAGAVAAAEAESSTVPEPHIAPVTPKNDLHQIPKQRVARSMSPPRSKTTISSNSTASAVRRPAAAWKGAPEDDAQFREEILAAHVPAEDDEWLQLEMKHLTSFTRIFPMVKEVDDAENNEDGIAAVEQDTEDIHGQQERKIETPGGSHDEDNNDQTEDEDGEEDEGEEDEDEDGSRQKKSSQPSRRSAPTKVTANAKPINTAPKKYKAVSYEDILFQVFLYDRRQTMRLRCPLPNRAREKDADSASTSSTFLPPLDQPNSSRSTISSTTGKGVVGWKAPPKPTTKEPPKQPSQNQADAAKRLSQGLSVAHLNHSVRNRNFAQNHLNNMNGSAAYPQNSSNSRFSVVLDPQEYAGQGMNNSNSYTSTGYVPGHATHQTNQVHQQILQQQQYQQQQQQQQYYQQQPPPQNGVMWPSTKANRLLEESKINRMRLEAVRSHNASVLRQQVFYFEPQNEDLHASNEDQQIESGSSVWQEDSQSYRLPSQQRSNSFDSTVNINSSKVQNNAGTGSGKYGNRSNSMHLAGNSVMGNHSYAQQQQQMQRNAAAAGGANGMNNMMATKKISPHQLVVSGNAAPANAPNTGHSQEELLRQLFPSWF